MMPSQIDALIHDYLTTTLDEFEAERLERRRPTDDEDEA
jgi:hypothetical protein